MPQQKIKTKNKPAKARGLFIVFEGGEGSGKSTQAKLLLGWFSKRRVPTLATKEPGDPNTPLCVQIRSVLLNPKNINLITASAELLLFEADRATHVVRTIQPALENGITVVCDRYQLSTLAYQCGGRGLQLKKVMAINDFATGGLKPDITFFMDIDPKIGLRRKYASGKLFQPDRVELENIKFHNRVHRGFLKYLPQTTKNYEILDARLHPKEIREIVIGHIKKLFTDRKFS